MVAYNINSSFKSIVIGYCYHPSSNCHATHNDDRVEEEIEADVHDETNL